MITVSLKLACPWPEAGSRCDELANEAFAGPDGLAIICENYIGSYRKTSNISHTLVSNKIVDNSDVVGASPVGAAPTTSSFST